MSTDYGFFTREEIEQDFAMKQIVNPHPSCIRCTCHVGCKNPKLEYTGEGRKKALIVAEANGKDEDTYKTQLIGYVGQWFRDKLSAYGLDLDRDFWKINSVNCFPHDSSGRTRTPTRREIEYCRPLVEKAIEETKPQFIWVLGNSAIESFYMHEFSTLSITRWRNVCIPDQKYKAWILPMYHPSFVRRSEGNDPTLDATYDRDLKFAVSCLERQPVEEFIPEKHCISLKKADEVVELLEGILKRQPAILAIDYETTGLKPQAPGHRIASVSLMEQGSDCAYSFPLQYLGHFDSQEAIEIKMLLRKILKDGKIGKIAHNLKFENSWSKFILGVDVENWKWCTMLCSHVLDTRQKFTGLKFQSYVNFGIRPYDKRIRKYLEATDGSGCNSVDKAPLGELLHYGAMDALLTYRLYKRQLDSFSVSGQMSSRNRLASAYTFMHEGNLALCEIQNTGICLDEAYYDEKDGELADQISAIHRKLITSPTAKRFEKETGRRLTIKGQNSQKDLKKLFTDVLGYEMELTEKENISLDEKALKKIDTTFTHDLLKMRKLEKLKGTYFAEFKREVCRGKMYPFFDLHIPRSLRSSSSAPNFQNIPVRDKEANKLCRSGVIPSPGFQLLENDYSGIEVAIAACYTKDPTLIAHVTNPKADMHRDSAADIWCIPQEEVTKDIRFYAKNCWVFPQFYGSYYGNCSEDLWEAVIEQELKTKSGDLVLDVIQDQGITDFDKFRDHCQEVEEDFWQRRFKVYKRWKDEIQLEYQERGYFETFFGFRFHGYLSYNQLCNYPIQGTAFHCLLWTLIRLMKERRENKWHSRIIGQIHDSIVWDSHPTETKHIMERTRQIGTKDILVAHPWINVPLSIEFEISPIDGSWYEKEPVDERKPIL